MLGVLVFEAARWIRLTDPARVGVILANQTTVALRNAQLYHQVPMVDALGALAAKKRPSLQRLRRQLQIYAAVALAALAALCFSAGR